MPQVLTSNDRAGAEEGEKAEVAEDVEGPATFFGFELFEWTEAAVGASNFGGGDAARGWSTMAATPSPVFSEVFILKGFKSCVLEVRIPKGLRARFS